MCNAKTKKKKRKNFVGGHYQSYFNSKYAIKDYEKHVLKSMLKNSLNKFWVLFSSKLVLNL